ncbi:CoxG family protein [Usitatibacter palustris]|uniref:Carbon monoxide dehydrogenase subunit G n=1 Tax=Usitatibacter palustris TaxID=2732487 RepID=A0A6M4H9Q3_9PROT|nr:carbon monoxide dehydrogenase subunit G [Usitatibacter palustris]QJR14777.1 hypothetical protein DSM104440_01587 [Usitatibacter palustris]
MELTSERILPVDRDTAWAALNDPDELKAAIPGCESIESTGENAYAVLLTAAIGPVKAKFRGKLQVTDIVKPQSYTIHFEGQGGPAGFGKGSAQVELVDQGKETLLKYRATAQVGGKIAQVGQRLVDAAAGKISDDFFATFSSRLAARAGIVSNGVQRPPESASNAPIWIAIALNVLVVAFVLAMR